MKTQIALLVLASCGRTALPVEDPPSFRIDCPEHFADCDGDGVCETDIGSDEASCGQCGNACADGLSCGAERCVPPNHVVQVEAAWDSTCALRADGRVFCWGNDRYGADGDWTTRVNDGTAYEVSVGDRAVGLGAWGSETCARLEHGGGECWGAGAPPTAVPALPRIAKLVPGCALTLEGEILCWGDHNNLGQLGNGSTQPSEEPVKVVGIDEAVGLDARCALLAGGNIACWGYDVNIMRDSQARERGFSSSPVLVKGLPLASTVNTDNAVACGISLKDSRPFMWSGNDFEVSWSAASKVVCNNSAACVATPRGTVACGPYVGHTEAIADLTGVIDLSLMIGAVCAVRDRGDVVCWGTNTLGQLGDGTFQDHDDPRPVVGLDVP